MPEACGIRLSHSMIRTGITKVFCPAFFQKGGPPEAELYKIGTFGKASLKQA